MTTRLYQEDAYLREFHAHIPRRLLVEDQPAVVLDCTAFYPTGGGQPSDRGELSGVDVLDVFQGDNGDIVHVLAGEISGDRVDGRIDWRRRHDHMQQHTGQHVLSQACAQLLRSQTVGFHLGDQVCTIDLDRADLTLAELEPAEQLSNTVVFENRQVLTRIVSSKEADETPLRRTPSVEGPLRVVEVSGFDWSACGGTHVAATGEIGLIKLVGAERHRGDTTRVSFLCGRRALADYQLKQRTVQNLAIHFTTSEHDVVAAVERLEEALKTAQQAQRRAQDALIATEAQALVARTEATGGVRLIRGAYEKPRWEADGVRSLAGLIVQQPGQVALLAWSDDNVQLTFARADDVPIDMGLLMRSVCERVGARGGGRPEWAQGGMAQGLSVADILEVAEELAREKLSSVAGQGPGSGAND